MASDDKVKLNAYEKKYKKFVKEHHKWITKMRDPELDSLFRNSAPTTKAMLEILEKSIYHKIDRLERRIEEMNDQRIKDMHEIRQLLTKKTPTRSRKKKITTQPSE